MGPVAGIAGAVIGGILGGGGGSSSSSTSAADNKTQVDVTTNVPVYFDSAPLAAAIQAVSGSTSATASAIVASAALNNAAAKSQAQTLATAIQSSSQGNVQSQYVVAVIGLIGVLIAAHIIKLRSVKV